MIDVLDSMGRALPAEAHASHVAVLSAMVRLCGVGCATEAPVDAIADRAHLADRATRQALRDMAGWGVIKVTTRRRPHTPYLLPSRIELVVPHTSSMIGASAIPASVEIPQSGKRQRKAAEPMRLATVTPIARDTVDAEQALRVRALCGANPAHAVHATLRDQHRHTREWWKHATQRQLVKLEDEPSWRATDKAIANVPELAEEIAAHVNAVHHADHAHYIAMQSTGKESLEELAVKFKGTRLGTIVTTVNVRREEYRNRLAKLNEREDAFNERECQIASTGTDAAPHDKLAF